jgi:antirestriction protein ArdC
MEELVAELGAAFLCADLELTPQISDDHTPYIASWLELCSPLHNSSHDPI